VLAPLLATAFTVLMVAVLLGAERRGDRRWRAVAKPLASLGFVAVPVVGGGLGHPMAPWIIAGLVLGMAGDVLLLAHDKRAFLAGLSIFLLGHVAYVVAFAHQVAPARWISAPMMIVAIPVAALAAVVVRWLWPHLGAMKVPVLAYVAVIATMLLGGVATARWSLLGEHARLLIAAGAALFFASDLAVARDRFVAAGFVNRAWGLPTYYAGQLLLAWSLLATS
jgi:uncharacterized membrane protein YhhN